MLCKWVQILLLIVLSYTIVGCKKTSSFQGYVEGEYVYIASPFSGRLDSLLIKRGQEIKRNTPLFVLESVYEKAGVDEALANIQYTISNLNDLEKGKRPTELDVVRAQIEQAIAEEKNAAIHLKRDKQQYTLGGISKSELDDSYYIHQANNAKLKEKIKQLESDQLPARSDRIRAAQAQISIQRAKLLQAKWILDQKFIRSTRQGQIVDTLYRQGEWVPAGNPIVQMLPPENIKIRFFVPEPMLGKITLNQPIKIHVDGNDIPMSATITYISPQEEYTPPVIFSNDMRSKLIFMVEAHPSLKEAKILHPGQPVMVTFE